MVGAVVGLLDHEPNRALQRTRHGVSIGIAGDGTITMSGTSEAIRLEKASFKAHPEFRQKAKVQAHVIGPGTMLVAVADNAEPQRTSTP